MALAGGGGGGRQGSPWHPGETPLLSPMFSFPPPLFWLFLEMDHGGKWNNRGASSASSLGSQGALACVGRRQAAGPNPKMPVPLPNAPLQPPGSTGAGRWDRSATWRREGNSSRKVTPRRHPPPFKKSHAREHPPFIAAHRRAGAGRGSDLTSAQTRRPGDVGSVQSTPLTPGRRQLWLMPGWAGAQLCPCPLEVGSVPQQPQHLLRVQQLLPGLPRSSAPVHLLSVQFLPV